MLELGEGVWKPNLVFNGRGDSRHVQCSIFFGRVGGRNSSYRRTNCTQNELPPTKVGSLQFVPGVKIQHMKGGKEGEGEGAQEI